MPKAGVMWTSEARTGVGFGELLATDGVTEHLELRSRFGFMAYHGGALEEMTDVIAAIAAERSNSSYYGIVQPPGTRLHVASTAITPEHSVALRRFIDHVDTVITVHGFGRAGLFTSILVGGRNRDLAGHIARYLGEYLPAYDIVAELDQIPTELRGLHPANPVNLPAAGGVQLELPPRVRGTSPLWWDWDRAQSDPTSLEARYGIVPHTAALIDALAAAARNWQDGDDDDRTVDTP